ncbi:hypothetical protein GCM10010272_67670 [Streptomyces lateritius]|nr:hypothetical protein GCM10010272_67670 [Streptomyces lateritius]
MAAGGRAYRHERLALASGWVNRAARRTARPCLGWDSRGGGYAVRSIEVTINDNGGWRPGAH